MTSDARHHAATGHATNKRAAAAIVMANFLSALPRAGTKRNAKSVATKTVTPMMRLEANISPATATPAKTAPK